MIQLRFFICMSFLRCRRRPPRATIRVAPAPRPAGLEAHAYACPELIVVADVVDVVEADPSLPSQHDARRESEIAKHRLTSMKTIANYPRSGLRPWMTRSSTTTMAMTRRM